MKKIILGIFLANLLWSCNSNSLTEAEKETYKQQGSEIAKATFKKLSSNLTEKMKEGGPTTAVPFCNVQAMPLTAEISNEYNVSIKRISDKYRNIINKPSERELEIIGQYKVALHNKEELTPIVEINTSNNKQFYAPIVIQDKCLTCHGILGETLEVKTDSLIKTMYPHDIATGYQKDELRGIWSIEFKQ